jgi:hypothetical protein
VTKTAPVELYLAEDGYIFRVSRLQGNSLFTTYSALSCEELRDLRDLLCNDKIKRKTKAKEAGSTGDPQATEPTIGKGARTDTREPAPTPAGTSAVRMASMEAITYTNVLAV